MDRRIRTVVMLVFSMIMIPAALLASDINSVLNSIEAGSVSQQTNAVPPESDKNVSASTSGGSDKNSSGQATGTAVSQGAQEKVEYGYVDVNSWLNVRTGPGTSHQRIGKLYRGHKVTIVGEQSGWYKIKYNNGTAWVSARYVSKTKVDGSDYDEDNKPNIPGGNNNDTPGGNDKPNGGAGSQNGVLKVPKRSQFSSENVVNGTDYRNSWCGPNSFAMVLDYYGIHKSAYECAKLVEYTFKERNGTPITGIVNGAHKCGFSKTHVSSGQSMEWLKAQVAAGKPVIVNVDTKWKGHYIVVVGFKGNDVVVNDPGKGDVSRVQYTMSRESFWSCWSSKDRRAVVLQK